MGFLDKAKDLADKAQDLAAEHADKVQDGIDKAEGLADKATGGKYSEQIEGAGEKAAGYVEGLDSK